MMLFAALIVSVLFANTLPCHAVEIAGEPTGREIAVSVDEREDGDDQISMATWTLTNKSGKTRIRRTFRYWKDYDDKDGLSSKSFIVFDRPPDVKDTTFLNWSYEDYEADDDQWIYLPALRKVRRIASGDKENAFMGSDLIYDDLGDREVDEDTFTLLRVEEHDGVKMYVVQAIAKKENYIYSRRVAWVNAETWTIPRMEFYDRKKRLLKVMLTDWVQIDGIWNPKTMTVENQLNGHHTRIENSDVKFNQGLKESLFTERSLRKGKP